jgi:hypothetical protein
MGNNSFNNFNRKLHIHLGLLLLFFIWVFSFSGLILNHGNWKFASFWEEREESKTDIRIPLGLFTGQHIENDILEYLKLKGEVQELKQTSEFLDFRVQSPGIVRDLHIDVKTGEGTEKILKFNMWGKLRTLHTFNGMKKENPAQAPNWLITNIWRLTMDGIAIGLMIICISSWVMWYRIRHEYKASLIILITGFIAAGYFVFG